jgi:hypothetical protein
MSEESAAAESDKLVARPITPEGRASQERAKSAILEYKRDIEDILGGINAVASGVERVMSDRKCDMLLGMIDELHDQLLSADSRVGAVIPGGNIPASSAERKTLMGEINMLRELIKKSRISNINLRHATRIIAHATEHAPAVAHAALRRMVYNK